MQLFQLLLYLANYWQKTWQNIEDSINKKLENEITKKYTQQNKKTFTIKKTTAMT
jgi:hypothetical protein